MSTAHRVTRRTVAAEQNLVENVPVIRPPARYVGKNSSRRAVVTDEPGPSPVSPINLPPPMRKKQPKYNNPELPQLSERSPSVTSIGRYATPLPSITSRSSAAAINVSVGDSQVTEASTSRRTSQRSKPNDAIDGRQSQQQSKANTPKGSAASKSIKSVRGSSSAISISADLEANSKPNAKRDGVGLENHANNRAGTSQDPIIPQKRKKDIALNTSLASSTNTQIKASEILIALRLPTGKRIEQMFKTSQQLLAVVKFAEKSSARKYPKCYLLCHDPQKKFTDFSKTIGACGLAGRTLLHLNFPDS